MAASLMQRLKEWDAGNVSEAQWRRKIDAAFPGFLAQISSLDHELKQVLGAKKALKVTPYGNDWGRERARFSLDVISGWSQPGNKSINVTFIPKTANTPALLHIDRSSFEAAEPAIEHLTQTVFEITKDWPRIR